MVLPGSLSLKAAGVPFLGLGALFVCTPGHSSFRVRGILLMGQEPIVQVPDVLLTSVECKGQHKLPNIRMIRFQDAMRQPEVLSRIGVDTECSIPAAHGARTT